MTGMKSLHPGLHVILDKLHQGVKLSDGELTQLRRQVGELEERERGGLAEGVADVVSVPSLAPSTVLAGRGTRSGTDRLASRSGKKAASFYRAAQEVFISTLGVGTYQGTLDSSDDTSYAATVHYALQRGINLIDTAINYRHQRSERAVAEGIRRFTEANFGSRDEVVVCTKGGFLVPGAVPTNCINADDVVEGTHCITPAFLIDQIRRSRLNLGLETIDVYYLHNPETQLKAIGTREFMDRISSAFECLERAASEGWIQYYGVATWNGFRGGMLSLQSLIDTACEIAGGNHHFRFVQLPFNLGMQEAGIASSKEVSVLASAINLGITVVASSSLLQGRLARDLPMHLARMLPELRTDAQRSIQFTRSSPGIASALVGMRSMAHLIENLAVSDVSPIPFSTYQRLSAEVFQ